MYKFTLVPDGNVVVKNHMDKIGEFIRAQLGADLVALILTGSFGRGEGSVFQRKDGAIEPLNDYDFLLVVKDKKGVPSRKILADWEARCSTITGMRWIDFAAMPESRLEKLPLTQANYDLRWGGQVLSGVDDILERMPFYKAWDIPLSQAQILLTTRMWCFIGTEPFRILNDPDLLSADGKFFTLQQMSKALIATGDSLLMVKGRYCVKYAEKAARAAALEKLSEQEQTLLAWGYAFKLGEIKNVPPDYGLTELFSAALNLHLRIQQKVRRNIPAFRRRFFIHFLRASVRLVRRFKIDGLRRLLLDCVQLRLLQVMQKNPQAAHVDFILSAMLWLHCGEWISEPPSYAAKVAELRLI